MQKSLLYFLVFLTCLGVAWGADVFTTTGAAGEKVYTDKPARNTSKIELDYQKAPPVDPTELKSDDGKSMSEMTPCEKAQYIVAQYTDAEVLADEDSAGNTRILDEEEAATVIERARADEKRLCKEQDDDDA